MFPEWLRESVGVDDMWERFEKICENAMKENIPRKSVNSFSDPPYYNKKVLRLKRKARKYHNVNKHTQKYTEDILNIKAELNKAKAEAKDKYMQNMFKIGDANGGWTNMYRHVKRQKGNERDIPTLIHENGEKYINDIDKAESLNTYFSSVFSNEVDEKCYNVAAGDSRGLNPLKIHEAIILKIINGLKNGKAPGEDGLTGRFFKIGKNSIVPYLLHIFRKSLETGKIPESWKHGTIIPIFKAGEKCRMKNYRPISLTSIVSKIFERILSEYIRQILYNSGFLFSGQHGFRKGYSCESQLTSLVQDLEDSIDQGFETDALFLDMQKAFDLVPHDLLLEKLNSVIDDKLVVNWVGEFLRHRFQSVRVGRQMSQKRKVDSGVPQGTVLGPLLFVIFVNDIVKGIQSKIRLFADDVIIYREVKSINDTVILQEDLDKVKNWTDKNKMKLNESKCEFVKFSRKRLSSLSEHKYILNGRTLPEMKGYKYLGVWLDKRLDWCEQVRKVSMKALSSLNFVMRNLQGSKEIVKEHAYKTLIRPILEYGGAIWDPYTEQDTHKIERVQRIAVRRVTGKMKIWRMERNKKGVIEKVYESPTQMMSELEWTTLQHRRQVSRLCNLYRAVSDNQGWEEVKSKIRGVRGSSRRKGHKWELEVASKQSKTVVGQNSFLNRTVQEWNALKEDVFGDGKMSTKIFRKNIEELKKLELQQI